MHARTLRKHGEGWQRINSLPTWREAGLYTARERAALNWAETMTQLVGFHGNRDGEFDALKSQFSDQEIVELSWVIAQINAWNRMAIGMQAPVAERAMPQALENWRAPSRFCKRLPGKASGAGKPALVPSCAGLHRLFHSLLHGSCEQEQRPRVLGAVARLHWRA